MRGIVIVLFIVLVFVLVSRGIQDRRIWGCAAGAALVALMSGGDEGCIGGDELVKYEKFVGKSALTPAEKRECAKRVSFSRTIDPDSRTMPYRRRGGGRDTLHWGQRKLLLSEIEFLALHGDKGRTAVYIGAADGKHMPLLSRMFPDHKLVLYDPRDFHPQTVKYAKMHPDRMEIRQQYFTDEDVEEFAKQDGVLFISDIRTMPEQVEGESRRFPSDEDVIGDLERQQKWILEMKPAAYMLKVRLPYTPGKFKYLDANIYLQVWPGLTSSETRFIDALGDREQYPLREYDNIWYEDVLFRFNNCTRHQPFELLVESDEIRDAVALGLPKSYDLLAEQHILAEYLRNIRGVESEEKIREGILELQKMIRENLGYTLSQRYKTRFVYHDN